MDFNQYENDMINFWKYQSIQSKIKFKRQRENGEKFRFLDGPPFANGTPHHGHLLVSYIKDTYSRYKQTQGNQINYQLGLDCHGLPLEQEAEKIVGKTSVYDSPDKINKFIETSQKIIKNSADKWFNILGRIGRQFEEKETYYTSNLDYMTSLWENFKILFDKGLIYQSKKVMPYSTELATPLSNFEANSNYQEKSTTSIYLKFELKEKFLDYEKVNLLVWTTTPWSLLANQGICINKGFDYVLVTSREQNYIILHDKKLLKKMFNNEEKIQVIFKGSDLVGREYKPIFNYSKPNKDFTFKIYQDDYVSDESGTGLVHLAPLFGNDDMRVMMDNDYQVSFLPDLLNSTTNIKKDIFINKENLKDRKIMETSDVIIENLKQNNILFKTQKIRHNYPFCWRTDTPLIYLAVDAWFLDVQKIKEDLLKNNEKINWFPKHVGQARFSNWIKDAPDWCLSRNRVWGTPIPIWISEDNNILCVDKNILEEITKEKYEDLHINKIPETFTYQDKLYKRTPYVLDCWFESGMAGIASKTTKEYPVDFITESLDQTRGWFYTLNVLSTALNNQPAFNNVVVSGLILAEDGKKMSKRLKNYTSPDELIKKYGSDFIRLYLIGSPAAKAEFFAFKDSDISEITRKFIPYWNAFKFFNEVKTNFETRFKDENYEKEPNTDLEVVDEWLDNLTKKLAVDIKNKMDSLEINMIPKMIFEYWDKLTNSYIKFNRERFKGLVNKHQADISVKCLERNLLKSLKIFSPFMPYLTEYLYQKYFGDYTKSIHEEIYLYQEEYDNDILKSFKDFGKIVQSVRELRGRNKINVKMPLNQVILYLKELGLSKFNYLLQQETNIKSIVYNDINLLSKKYIPNRRNIGKKYKKQSKEISQLILEGKINGLEKEMYDFEYLPLNDLNSNFDQIITEEFHVYLDKQISEENELEFKVNNMRKLINQKRGENGFHLYNFVNIYFVSNEFWDNLPLQYFEELKKKTNSNIIIINNKEEFIKKENNILIL